MIFKINRYEVPTYNGYFTLELPKFSNIVGVLANNTEPGKTPIQVLVEESVATLDEEVETRTAKLLVVADGSPYGDAIKDDEFLMYIGHAMWDNGYRINHVLEVIDDQLEMELDEASDNDLLTELDEAVETVEVDEAMKVYVKQVEKISEPKKTEVQNIKKPELEEVDNKDARSENE